MKKIRFCECMKTLREYAVWERKMYNCSFDMAYTPITGVLERLHEAMCDFNPDWAYDAKLEFDWIIEWVYSPDSPNFEQQRHGREFDLSSAGALYDFLVFMNEHGWEDSSGE